HPWISPGQTLDLGLRFQLDKGWHIYWVNPGDSGEPPRVEWQLPAGLTAGAIEWPTPRRFESGTIVDYGYEDAVLLIVPLQAAANLPTQQPIRIDANVKLLVCSHEMCVPGKAELSLTLPIKSPPMLNVHNNVVRKQDVENEHLFTATSQSLPRPAPPDWRLNVADTSDRLSVDAAEVRAPAQAHRAPARRARVCRRPFRPESVVRYRCADRQVWRGKKFQY